MKSLRFRRAIKWRDTFLALTGRFARWPILVGALLLAFSQVSLAANGRVIAEPGRSLQSLTESVKEVEAVALPGQEAGTETERWVPIRFVNQTGTELTKVLAISRPAISGSGIWAAPVRFRKKIEATIRDPLQVDSVTTNRLPQHQTLLRLVLPSGSETELYLLQNDALAASSITLWNPEAHARYLEAVTIFFGVLLGILFTLVAYVAARMAGHSDRQQIVLFGYLVSACLFVVSAGGLLGALTDIPEAIESGGRNLSLGLLIIFGIGLASFASQSDKRPHWTYWIGVTLQGLAAIAIILGFVGLSWAASLTRFLVLLAIAYSALLLFLPAPQQQLNRLVVGSFGLVFCAVLVAMFAALAPTGDYSIMVDPLIHGVFATSVVMGCTAFLARSEPAPTTFDQVTEQNTEPVAAPEPVPATTEALPELGSTLADENRYALGIAGAHQGLWDWIPEGDQLFLSPAVDAMLGMPAGGLERKEAAWSDRIHPSDRETYIHAMRSYLERGNVSFSIEFRMRHEDGEYLWLQLRATCLPGHDSYAARVVGVVSDITPTKAAEEKLLQDPGVDPVTGLMGRQRLLEYLEGKAPEDGAKFDGPFAGLIVADIDRFKTINDGLGHEAGDVFLSTIGSTLMEFAGERYLVARTGSDEFGLLVPVSELDGEEDEETGWRDQLIALAEKMKAAISEPIVLAGQEVFPSYEFGVAPTNDGHERGEDLLQDAEIAMFSAKRTGGGEVVFFKTAMRDNQSDTLSLEADLRRALERQQIKVYYQPIFDLTTERLAGFEALVRWEHPTRGLLLPNEFVGLAEETDMIVPVGRFVLSLACFQLARWQNVNDRAKSLFVSVNISSRQLRRDDFLNDVKNVIDASNLSPSTLKLEVTESLVLEDPDNTKVVLDQLREIGVGVTLDDFGTGFATLSNLQKYPFDTLKVDRSFVSTMMTTKGSSIIVEMVINLARSLDLNVIAEGAETHEDVKVLADLGCTFGQGFLFGEALESGAAETLVEQRA